MEVRKASVMDERLDRISFLLGSAILVFLASTLLLNSALFALRFTISPLGFVVALGSTVSFIHWGTRKYFDQKRLLTMGIIGSVFLIILIASIFASGLFYDVSYDGQTYHQEAVSRLSHGWNPVRNPPLQNEYGIWINHYPKAPWIYAAQFYKITGRMEQAKSANTLLMFAAFFLSLAAFLRFDGTRRNRALLFSLLASLNPVSVYQSLCFYVDGQLASLLLVLAALSYLLFRDLDAPAVLIFISCTVMLLNTKFTGIVYAVVFHAALATWFLMKRRKDVFRFAGIILASYVLALFFVGYNPYVTNVLRKGHPFYPLAGPKSADVIIHQEPENFQHASRVKKLLTSIFSQTDNVSRRETTKWKWPFSLDIPELVALTTPDSRIAGFGPWFGGAFLLSIIMILASLPQMVVRQANPTSATLLGMIFFIALSVLANPESWWARYSPQLWMIPVGASLLGLYGSKKKALIYLSRILAVALAVNIFIFSCAYLTGQSIGTWRLKRQLRYLAGCPPPATVNFHGFTANKLRFAEWGILYKESEDIPNEPKRIIRLFGSETQVGSCRSPQREI